jgi:hypothetical protein
MQIMNNSVVSQDILTENMQAFQSFLRQSYDTAKKQWDDGVSFFKDEFSTLRNRTGTYLNRIVLPVNNFLKEVDQIDSELKTEKVNFSNGSAVIPVELAAAISSGEENY